MSNKNSPDVIRGALLWILYLKNFQIALFYLDA